MLRDAPIAVGALLFSAIILPIEKIHQTFGSHNRQNDPTVPCSPKPRKIRLRDGQKRRSMGGMKAAVTLATAMLVFQQSLGCNQSTKPVEKVRHYPPIHRFVNVPSSVSPGVALDTVTGQYCKTWDWAYNNASLKGGLDTLPTCLSIFQGTPSNPNDPLGILGQQK